MRKGGSFEKREFRKGERVWKIRLNLKIQNPLYKFKLKNSSRCLLSASNTYQKTAQHKKTAALTDNKKSTFTHQFSGQIPLNIRQNFARHTQNWDTATMETSVDSPMVDMSSLMAVKQSSTRIENAKVFGKMAYAHMALDVSSDTERMTGQQTHA